MKRVIFLIFLIVFSSIVLAGTKHYIDLSDGREIITLSERDAIEFKYFIRIYDEEGDFKLKETTQRIFVDTVNTNKGSVELSNFIEGAETPFYVRINKATKMVLDFDKDDIKDLEVSLVNISNKEITLSLKELKKIEDIEIGIIEDIPITEEVIEEEKQEVEEKVSKTKESPYFVSLLAENWEITAIILLIILILVWNKRRIRRAIRRAMI